jgi:threonine dehydrogenase-like Zn-dependent dehydrogenase
MKALQKIGPTKAGVRLMEVPEPTIGLNDLLIEVACVGICGSDLHIWRDEKEHRAPVTLGHEFSGLVVAAGRACRRIKVGDRVCCDIETMDGRIGTHVDGGCAPRVSVPENVAHLLPPEVGYEEGALVELVTCMAHSLMYRSRLNPADFVVILGPGPIGLTLLQLVRLWNPRAVFVTGLKDDGVRFELAKQLGADKVLYCEDDPVKEVMAATGGIGADLVIDATGGEAAITQATRMVRMGGWVTVVGLWGHDIKVNLDMVPYRCLTLRGGWGWAGQESGDPAVKMAVGFESWEIALRILALGKLDIRRLVTKRIGLDDWERSYNDLEAKREVKVMMYPNPSLCSPLEA